MSFKEYLKESLNKSYASIVFLQNSQDFEDFVGSGGEGQDGFFNSDEEEMAKFLSQWDYGTESETDITHEKPWGESDTVVNVDVPNAGNYWLVYNRGLGYAGLVREITGE